MTLSRRSLADHTSASRSLIVPLLTLLLALAGCDGAAPDGPCGGRDYYLYDGARVYLCRDTALFSVAFADGVPRADGLALLDRSGLDVLDTVAVLSYRHYLVRARGGVDAERFYTTYGDAPTAALGDRADVRFAAPAYHDANTGKLVLLMNELIVRFKPSVTRADVEALGARFGTRIVQTEGTLGTNRYLLAVTRASPANALHVALAYAALPTAEYAEPNLVSRITYVERGQ